MPASLIQGTVPWTEPFSSCSDAARAASRGVLPRARWPGGEDYNQLKGLILAQNERWRRGLGMQVVRHQARKGAGERRKGE